MRNVRELQQQQLRDQLPQLRFLKRIKRAHHRAGRREPLGAGPWRRFCGASVTGAGVAGPGSPRRHGPAAVAGPAAGRGVRGLPGGRGRGASGAAPAALLEEHRLLVSAQCRRQAAQRRRGAAGVRAGLLWPSSRRGSPGCEDAAFLEERGLFRACCCGIRGRDTLHPLLRSLSCVTCVELAVGRGQLT